MVKPPPGSGAPIPLQMKVISVDISIKLWGGVVIGFTWYMQMMHVPKWETTVGITSGMSIHFSTASNHVFTEDFITQVGWFPITLSQTWLTMQSWRQLHPSKHRKDLSLIAVYMATRFAHFHSSTLYSKWVGSWGKLALLGRWFFIPAPLSCCPLVPRSSIEEGNNLCRSSAFHGQNNLQDPNQSLDTPDQLWPSGKIRKDG